MIEKHSFVAEINEKIEVPLIELARILKDNSTDDIISKLKNYSTILNNNFKILVIEIRNYALTLEQDSNNRENILILVNNMEKSIEQLFIALTNENVKGYATEVQFLVKSTETLISYFARVI